MRLSLLLTFCCLAGCSLWPYKSDFDCKIPNGEHCCSLYTVNKFADSGKYAPENNQRASQCQAK